MIAAGIALIGLSGCSATLYTSPSSRAVADDLYGIHDRQAIARQEALEQEQARKAAEAAALAEAKMEGEYLRKYTGNPYEDVLADTYDDAYARRLRGFNSPTYKMPSSYYNFKISDAAKYASAYDPSFYNVMVMGDEVWVEPKYITSMFGYWGASPVNVNINLGWGYPYWGSYWSWYDPYWGWGSPWWNRPYWGPYYSWGYYPHWGWGYPYWGGHHHWGGGYYSRPDVTYRPNYRPYNNGGNRYGSSTGYRSNTRNNAGSYNSGYRNRYDKDNSSTPGYRYSRPSNSNSGSTYRPGGGSGSHSTPSGGGGSYGGGSRGGGGRGR